MTAAARVQKGSEVFSNLCKIGMKAPKVLKPRPGGGRDS